MQLSDFLGLLSRVGACLEEEGEGEEESDEGRCKLICVICFFTFRNLTGFSCSSSQEESESVASWSVIMILTSFCCVFLLVLHTGSLLEKLISVEVLSCWSLKADCTGMPEVVKGRKRNAMEKG